MEMETGARIRNAAISLYFYGVCCSVAVYSQFTRSALSPGNECVRVQRMQRHLIDAGAKTKMAALDGATKKKEEGLR